MRSRSFRNRTSLFAVALCLSLAAGCFSRQPHGYQPSYRGARLVAVADIRFDDGDTFDYRGKPIRVLGIDTPEIAHPELGVHEDQPYGRAAAESTRAWIEGARTVEIVFDGRDIYNRTLAHVFIDGELLACRLIRHALAYETVSHYGDSGYPDLSQEILDTARSSPKPKFEPPYRWKQKHRPKKSARGSDSPGVRRRAPGEQSGPSVYAPADSTNPLWYHVTRTTPPGELRQQKGSEECPSITNTSTPNLCTPARGPSSRAR